MGVGTWALGVKEGGTRAKRQPPRPSSARGAAACASTSSSTGQPDHRCKQQDDAGDGPTGPERWTVDLCKTTVPDRPVHDAQVHEVDQQRLLGYGAEDVRKTRDALTGPSDEGQQHERCPHAQGDLIRDASHAPTPISQHAQRPDDKGQRDQPEPGREKRHVRIPVEPRGTPTQIPLSERHPDETYAAHGKTGNCEPVDGVRYADNQSGSRPSSPRARTAGVTQDSGQRQANGGPGEHAARPRDSTRVCTPMNVTPISCRTSTARNDRHCSGVAVGSWTNRCNREVQRVAEHDEQREPAHAPQTAGESCGARPNGGRSRC